MRPKLAQTSILELKLPGRAIVQSDIGRAEEAPRPPIQDIARFPREDRGSPGLWMSEREVARLRHDLRKVAQRSVPDGELDYGVFSEREDAPAGTIVTVVYRVPDGEPDAFNACPVIQVSLSGKSVDVLHLGLVMIDPAVRSAGLSWVLYGLTCFLLFLRNQLRPLWISNVTQVPAVAGMVAETAPHRPRQTFRGRLRPRHRMLESHGMAGNSLIAANRPRLAEKEPSNISDIGYRIYP